MRRIELREAPLVLRTCCRLLLVHALVVAMAAAGVVGVPSGHCCRTRASAGDDAAVVECSGGCDRCERATDDEAVACPRCRRAEHAVPAPSDVADRCGCRCTEETEAVATAPLPERRSQPQDLLVGTTAAAVLPFSPTLAASTALRCSGLPGGSPRPLWIVHCALLT